MRSITGVGLCILLVLCGDLGFGQVSRLDPAEPAWGDTLTVTYDTEAEEAVLTGAAGIYAFCRLVYSDHSFKEFSVQLEKKGSRYLHSIPVEERLAYVDFSFFSFESVDARAFTTKGILRSDGRRARQGAYLNTIRFSDDPEEEFRKEIELYPGGAGRGRIWRVRTRRQYLDIEGSSGSGYRQAGQVWRTPLASRRALRSRRLPQPHQGDGSPIKRWCPKEVR